MTQLIIDLVHLVIGMLERACTGDEQALKKLIDFAPDHLRTELVARVQDELDRQKFGER